MKLPFTIIKQYNSSLSVAEIKSTIENNVPKKQFGGLSIDKYTYEFPDKSFKIHRYSNGLDVFTASFPVITGEIVTEDPTLLNLKLVPNYFSIAFFLFFVITFTSVALFSNKDNLGFSPSDSEIIKRLANFIGGAGVPGIWCYLRYIRPIKKTEQWIKEKLHLE